MQKEPKKSRRFDADHSLRLTISSDESSGGNSSFMDQSIGGGLRFVLFEAPGGAVFRLLFSLHKEYGVRHGTRRWNFPFHRGLFERPPGLTDGLCEDLWCIPGSEGNLSMTPTN